MRRWWLVLVLWCAAALGSAIAEDRPGPVPVLAAESYDLSPSFMFLEDRSARMTLQDVLKPEAQNAFKPVSQKGPGANFGLTSSAIWLRVTLSADAKTPEHWLLELAYPPLDRIELFAPDAAAGFDRQVGGDQQPFASRAVRHRNHVLPVRLAPGVESTLYLRLKSEGTLSAPVRLWQPAALWNHDQGNYAALSVYFGLLIGLFLYNLLLFLSVRDVAYLIYVAFAGCMGIAQAALTGMGAQFLWTDWTWWNGVSPTVGMASAAAFALLFCRSFLASAARMPRIDKFILSQLAAWLLTVLAALLLPYAVSSWMVAVLAVVSVATMVAAGFLSIQRGYAGARYFFTAWALLLLGVFTLALHSTGVLPSNVITANALLIGSALEMVLLSFALANRINVARRFKEQAQTRIAAERAMVEALSHSKEQLRTVLEEREIILESSIVGIAFLNADGRFRWANRAMLDIFGTRGRASVSMEPYYLSREEYLRVGGEVAASVARGEVYVNELQMRRSDGTLIWVSLSGKAVRPHDLSQGTVWVIMNITHRKELETQLHKTSSEREAILNSALVGIAQSVAGRYEWVNEKFASMLGYPRQMLIGKPSSYVGEDARAALTATGSYVCERQVKRRNGELLWVEMGGSCIRAKDPESGVIWTFLDITERKKSEGEIREALEQQKSLNELRSRFVAMTSHEFRTPLAAILSAEELLRHYGDKLAEPERREVLDSISSGVKRMSRMMDAVLLLGKADAGMLGFSPERIALAPLCRQIVDEARAQEATRGDIALALDPDANEGVYDEKLLRHIFSNLLSNALKYSPQGEQVSFAVRRESESMVFEVADRGIGIPSAEIPHLFMSFHRASNVGSIPGSGLGLAIVKNAVDMHGGSIDVASTLGQGTVVKVTLPH